MKNTLQQILIDIPSQQLHFLHEGKELKIYPISTGLNGVGEQKGSGQTPRGWHIIRAKIGNNQPINTIFVGRRPLEEIYSETLEEKYPGKDWILTRVLWLSGLELGKNRLGDCDTMQRYIYIHGCPDSKPMGIPLSHGCIRMRNFDIVELFNHVPVGTKVFIRG
jgi:lipoprotein-anchoring transpeptidase ErfK/SrfK